MSQKNLLLCCTIVSILVVVACRKDNRFDTPDLPTEQGKTGYNPTIPDNKFAIRNNRLFALFGDGFYFMNIDNNTGELGTPYRRLQDRMFDIPKYMTYNNNMLFISTSKELILVNAGFISNYRVMDRIPLWECTPKGFIDNKIIASFGNATCQGFNSVRMYEYFNLVTPTQLVWNSENLIRNPRGITTNLDFNFFVCTPNSVQVWDITSISNAFMVNNIEIANPLSVQAIEDILFITTSEDGIYQYDISDVAEIEYLGKIPIH